MWRAGKRSLQSRLALLCALALLLAAGTGSLVGQETDASPRLDLSMSERSENLTSGWQSLDDLLTELIAESEASLADWIALSVKLGALQTEAEKLSSSLEASRKQYALSVQAWAEVTTAAQKALNESEKARAKAERERDVWRVVGISAAVLGTVCGVVAWYSLTH